MTRTADRERPKLPLDGFRVSLDLDAIAPVRHCARHLSALGAQLERAALEPNSGHGSILRLTSDPQRAPALDGPIECATTWRPDDPGLPGNEALIQAISGLMAVHGRDRGVPRRLGLELASVAAGILTSQGALAALIAQSRGQQVRGVRTSVLQAALLFLYHHLAIATCGDDFPFRSLESGEGPPFATADGHWVELEAMTGESWKAFWARLGVTDSKTAGAAWLPFVYRYLAGRCSLPAALHEATRRLTLADLNRLAQESGVTLGRVRSYDDLLIDLGSVSENALSDFRLQSATPWSIEPCPTRTRPSKTATTLSGAPLAGMKVVEVTSRLQGPLAGQLLQLLGAEVLKVEPPGGDFGRISRPMAGSVGAAYLAYNRNKKTVEIDYKQPKGVTLLVDLASQADVFLHNWKSGRAEELGLDFTTLSARNPQLVYAHASAWGKMDPEPSPSAGDFLVQAYAACGDGIHPAGEPPFPSRLTLLDALGGLLACEGILAGLYQRERRGWGCRVETSLFSAAMSLQSEVLQAIVLDQEKGRRAGRPIWRWLDQPLPTSDGFLMVTCGNSGIEERFLQVSRIRGSVGDEALPANALARLHMHSAIEWARILSQGGIPCTPVCTDLAQLRHHKEAVPLLEPAEGACWVPTAPWHFRTAPATAA